MNCYHISEKLFTQLLKDDLYLTLGKWDYFKLEEDDHGQAAVFFSKEAYNDYVIYCHAFNDRLDEMRLSRLKPDHKNSLRTYFNHKGWEWKTEDDVVINWIKCKGYTLDYVL